MSPVPLLIDGMLGMGDNLYQIPVVGLLSERQGPLFIRTPWPQFYRHLPGVTPLRPITSLRTQLKNVSRAEAEFQKDPPRSRALKLTYTPYVTKMVPFYQGLCKSGWQNPSEYFLHIPQDPVLAGPRRNLAVIRPCTVRKEWKAPARNPKPEYIQWVIDYLNQKGVETVVVADVQPPQEVYAGPRPRNASAYLEHGELTPDGLLELFWSARLVAGPPGFLAPMAVATGTPALILHGGVGLLNAPLMIDAPGHGSLVHVLPEKHCMCRDRLHNCEKKINLCKLKQALDTLLDESRPSASPFPTTGSGMKA